MSRILIVLAGLAGAAGVALSARAAHAGGGNLGIAANMLLFHAPALLALGIWHGWARGPAPAIAAALLAVGLFLFCGDLVARDMLGGRLFPMAAPAGGVLLIAGWLAVSVSAFLTSRAH